MRGEARRLAAAPTLPPPHLRTSWGSQQVRWRPTPAPPPGAGGGGGVRRSRRRAHRGVSEESPAEDLQRPFRKSPKESPSLRRPTQGPSGTCVVLPAEDVEVVAEGEEGVVAPGARGAGARLRGQVGPPQRGRVQGVEVVAGVCGARRSDRAAAARWAAAAARLGERNGPGAAATRNSSHESSERGSGSPAASRVKAVQRTRNWKRVRGKGEGRV